MAVAFVRAGGLLDCQPASGSVLSIVPASGLPTPFALANLTNVDIKETRSAFEAPLAAVNNLDKAAHGRDLSELLGANRIVANKVGDRNLLLTLGGLYVVRPPRAGATLSILSSAKPPATALKVFPAQYDSAPPIDAKWHPLSDTHFVVLSKDGIRAFDATTDCSRPCDEWLFPDDLLAHGATATPGGNNTTTTHPFDPTALAFGSARGWELLSLFVLSTDGSVYHVTPVLPCGLVLPYADWYELVRATVAELNANNNTSGSHDEESHRRHGRVAALEVTYHWLNACFVDASPSSAAVGPTAEVAAGETAMWKRYLPPVPSAGLSSSVGLLGGLDSGDGYSDGGLGGGDEYAGSAAVPFARAGPVPADRLARLTSHVHQQSQLSPEAVSDALGRPWLPALQGPIAVAPEINNHSKQRENGGEGAFAAAPACDLVVIPASSSSSSSSTGPATASVSMLSVLFSDGRLCLLGAFTGAAIQPAWGQAYWPVPSMGPALPSLACSRRHHAGQLTSRPHQYSRHKHSSLSSLAASTIVSCGSFDDGSSSPHWLVLEALDLRLGHPLRVARAALDSGKGTCVGCAPGSGLNVRGFPQLTALATDARTGGPAASTASSSDGSGASVDVVQVPWLLHCATGSSAALGDVAGDGGIGSAGSGGSGVGESGTMFVVSRHALHLVRFGGLPEMRALMQKTMTSSSAASSSSSLERVAALARSKTACMQVPTNSNGIGSDGDVDIDIAGACICPTATSNGGEGGAGGPSLRVWSLSNGHKEAVVATAKAAPSASSSTSTTATLPGRIASFSLLSLVEQAAGISAAASAGLNLQSSSSTAATASSSSPALALAKLPPFSQVMRSPEITEALDRQQPITVPVVPVAPASADGDGAAAAASAPALAALKALSQTSTAVIGHALQLHRAEAVMQARAGLLYTAAEANITTAERLAPAIDEASEQVRQSALEIEKIQARNQALILNASNLLVTLARQSSEQLTPAEVAFRKRVDGYAAELSRSLLPRVERLRAQLEQLRAQKEQLARRGVADEEEEEDEEGENVDEDGLAVSALSPSTPSRKATSRSPYQQQQHPSSLPAVSSSLLLEMQRSVDAATRGVAAAKQELLAAQTALQTTEDEVHARLTAIGDDAARKHYAALGQQAREERSALASADNDNEAAASEEADRSPDGGEGYRSRTPLGLSFHSPAQTSKQAQPFHYSFLSPMGAGGGGGAVPRTPI